MKTTMKNLSLSRILCIVLIAASVLFTFGCKDNEKEKPADTAETTSQTQEETERVGTVTELGEGEKEFSLTVRDLDGNETKFLIHTDCETVGDALLALELISGEDGAYGLYVKTVNGITADFDTDGHYWAFYENDTYAASGVDTTKITEGTEYALRVE